MKNKYKNINITKQTSLAQEANQDMQKNSIRSSNKTPTKTNL
jgi:hypothetical protein